MNELIVRIAARGDGVTESGRHVPFGVPGDAVLDVPGVAERVGPTSTMTGALIVQAIVCEAVSKLVELGHAPRVLRSANSDQAAADPR